jgi:hypothetical protein
MLLKNVTHIENLTDPDYDEEIGMGLEGIKRIIRNWATEFLPNFALIDPTMLNDACDLGIKTQVTNTGTCPWDDDDPVHLSMEGYRDLAVHLREHVSSEFASEEASGSGSDFSSGKRRAPESVVDPPGSQAGLWAVSTTTVTGGREIMLVHVLVLPTNDIAAPGMEYGVAIPDGGRGTVAGAAGAAWAASGTNSDSHPIKLKLMWCDVMSIT